MDEKSLKLINKIISILSKKQYSLTLPSFYCKPIDKKNFLEYLRYYILHDFSQSDLETLKSKIVTVGNKYNICGVGVKNGVITKVVLPNMVNVLSTLVIVHEFQHYIAFKNKLREGPNISLYDELIPLNSEFKYLMEFYKDNLKEHENYRFNEAIKRAHILSDSSNEIVKQNFSEIINHLSHIYSFFILYQNNDYIENSSIFDRINRTQTPLKDEFIKEGIYLKKSIIKTLKSID